jgi:hypothetical protein
MTKALKIEELTNESIDQSNEQLKVWLYWFVDKRHTGQQGFKQGMYARTKTERPNPPGATHN